MNATTKAKYAAFLAEYHAVIAGPDWHRRQAELSAAMGLLVRTEQDEHQAREMQRAWYERLIR